jgi:hypothetical protein
MIGERDWLPKRRLSLDYLYIIRLKALLCCIWLWEARGVLVGIDNKANRYVCDMISEVLRNFVHFRFLFIYLVDSHQNRSVPSSFLLSEDIRGKMLMSLA